MSAEGQPSELQSANGVAEGTDGNDSRWPQPVPEDWTRARAAKADEWFQQQKEELHSRYVAGKQAVTDEAATAAEAAATTAAYNTRLEAMVREQQAYSRSVQQQLSVLRQQRLQANLEYQALRLPHFTPPRPLALITAPDGGPSMCERLFNRALATTLMAAVGTAARPDRSPGGGVGSSAGSGIAGGEAVWCEQGQSRVSLQDPPLARAEALERCRVAIVVLSPALLASPQWAIERRILTARLTAPPGTWPGAPLSAILFVRLHVPPPASVGAAAVAAVKGMGRKAAAAVAAATSAAAAPDPHPPAPLTLPEPVPGYPVQSYPVKVMDLTVPLPVHPPLEGVAAATALAQAVRDTVATVLSEASGPEGCLAAAGLRLVPDPPPIHLHPAHVHTQPEQLLAASYGSSGSGAAAGDAVASTLTLGATLAGAVSSGSLATQLLASPARAAVAAGPAAAAAHLLPASYMQRAVEDWTMYDITAWLSSLGRSLERWSTGFLALAVDGPLLVAADDTDLRAACGVAADKAVSAIREALNSALRRPSVVPPARALLPGSDAPAAPLPPEAAAMPLQQRGALLADIFAYYDQDHSGDLNPEELNRLVQACGLRLDDTRLKDVLDDYDDDSDGRLNRGEAERLLEDVWRLVMAQQDLAAWTPSEAATALKDAVELSWPLETPRATPDAEKTAARMAAAAAATATAGGKRVGGGGGGGGGGGTLSETSSINIVGGGADSHAGGDGGSTGQRRPSPAGSTPTKFAAVAPASAGGGGGSGGSRGGGGGVSSKAPATRSTSGSRRPPGSSPPILEGEDETGARVRLVDRTYSAAATRGSGSGGDGGEEGDDDLGNDVDGDDVGSVTSLRSYRSYGWGLPPRLSTLTAALSTTAVVRRQSDTASMSSDKAPWGGAITPKTARSGGKSSISPEEMAARDIDVQRLLRRERTEGEIKESLKAMLDCLDLRRRRRVELQMLRASLASSGPPNQLSPLHTQLLSDLAEAQAQLPTASTVAAAAAAYAAGSVGSGTLGSRRLLMSSGPLGEALLGLEVPVHTYISAAVQTVASTQAALMEVVYGDRGLSAMLRQLYRQTTGPDDPLELLTRGPRVHAGAAEAALEALMEVQGMKPTALIRAALLPTHQLDPEGLTDHDDEILSAADPRVSLAGGAASATGAAAAIPAALLLSCGPTPLSLHSARRYPQSWASATAHVVHVFQVLQRRCG